MSCFLTSSIENTMKHKLSLLWWCHSHTNKWYSKQKKSVCLWLLVFSMSCLHICLMATRCCCEAVFSWQSLRPFMKSERPSSYHGKVTGSHSDTAALKLHVFSFWFQNKSWSGHFITIYAFWPWWHHGELQTLCILVMWSSVHAPHVLYVLCNIHVWRT